MQWAGHAALLPGEREAELLSLPPATLTQLGKQAPRAVMQGPSSPAFLAVSSWVALLPVFLFGNSFIGYHSHTI